MPYLSNNDHTHTHALPSSCSAKPTQKVYPICTIRSTPDKPVHCIVWAKEAFKLVFGKVSQLVLVGLFLYLVWV